MTWSTRWIEYGLVLLASWLIAGAMIGKEKQIDIDIESTLIKTPKQKASGVDDSWKDVSLFGQADKKEEVKPVPNAPAQASKLNIKLIGTVVAGDKSAAMLMKSGGKEHEVFFLGESIQPNVKLVEVFATEIVIDNAGKRENISIEGGELTAVASKHSQPARQSVRSPRRPTHQRVDRKIDKGHLQNQMRNFSTLLSQARVKPHFTDKKADGFTISEIVKGSLYEEIGLQNGDVIQKVNGESVTSAEQAMRMYKELQNSTFIDVEINRDGSTQQVSYTIQ